MSLDHNSFTQALRVGMMLGRTPRIPFLESQQITKSGTVTAVSTAVQRLDMIRKATRIYVAGVIDGVGRVYYSFPEKEIDDHRWVPTYFNETAEDIAITFDGRCHKNGLEGKEFITNRDPWVFWVHNGQCKGKILGNLGETVFAFENCTKVDAICDLTKDAYFEGLGLVLFLLINGSIYYRQLLGNVWTDAELVTFGPSNVRWTDIQAFRTWDYRIGLQAVTENGDVYELFSRYKGFKNRLAEHVEVSDIQCSGSFFRIFYHSGKEEENVELTDINIYALYGGLYKIGAPVIVHAKNIEDDNNNWGTILVIKFDCHLVKSQVDVQNTSFRLIDSTNRPFVPYQSTLESDGLTVKLYFRNFNQASEQCSINYTPGTITSMAGYSVDQTSFSFTPVNLTGPTVPEPRVVNVFNI